MKYNLEHFSEIMNKQQSSNSGQINPWAKDSMAIMVGMDFMSNTREGTFSLQAPCTIEQAMVLWDLLCCLDEERSLWKIPDGKSEMSEDSAYAGRTQITHTLIKCVGYEFPESASC